MLIPIKFFEIIRQGDHSNSDPKYQEKSRQKFAKNQLRQPDFFFIYAFLFRDDDNPRRVN